MSWLDPSQYDSNDECPICYEVYGTTKGIYKTECNHIFHNDCLNGYCEHSNGNIVCPICRYDIEDACNDVWAFKNHALGNSSGKPMFNGNQHIQHIYKKNAVTSKGKKNKRIKKTKRTKRTKRMAGKNIRTKTKRRKIR